MKKAAIKAHQIAEQIKLPDQFHLNLGLEKLQVEGIAVYGEAICVNFDASGTATIVVHQFKMLRFREEVVPSRKK